VTRFVYGVNSIFLKIRNIDASLFQISLDMIHGRTRQFEVLVLEWNFHKPQINKSVDLDVSVSRAAKETKLEFLPDLAFLIKNSRPLERLKLPE